MLLPPPPPPHTVPALEELEIPGKPVLLLLHLDTDTEVSLQVSLITERKPLISRVSILFSQRLIKEKLGQSTKAGKREDNRPTPSTSITTLGI